MKKNQSSHPTAQSAITPKTVYDEYYDMISFRMKPVSETYILKLGEELVAWASLDKEALKITQFFKKRGIGSSTVANWRQRVAKFNDMYEFAKEVIGDRREIGGLKKKLDSGMISSTMPHYDPEWKSLAEWRNKLRNSEEESTRQIVVIEKFPELPSKSDPDSENTTK